MGRWVEDPKISLDQANTDTVPWKFKLYRIRNDGGVSSFTHKRLEQLKS